MDIACYIDQDVVENVKKWEKFQYIGVQGRFSSALYIHFSQQEKHLEKHYKFHLGVIQILAPVCWNPTDFKDLFEDKTIPRALRPPIHHAASKGYVDIIKILAPLTQNPNYYHYQGRYFRTECTPIFLAAKEGHTEIVKLLADMTDDPNVSSKEADIFDEYTPIHIAAANGHADIVEILVPLTNDPNKEEKRLLIGLNEEYLYTPMETACENGHNKVVEVLQSHGFKCKCGSNYATGELHDHVTKKHDSDDDCDDDSDVIDMDEDDNHSEEDNKTDGQMIFKEKEDMSGF